MIDFKIEVTGIKEATSFLTDLQKKQVPFATAKALTATANDIRDEIVKGLPQKYTLRTPWWKPRTKYGFNVEVAKKNKLTASIYTRAPWMQLHEEGGPKLPRGQHLAVPSKFVKRTGRGLISKGSRPRNLKNSFVSKGAGGQKTIFQRTRAGLVPMFFLEKRAKIKPTLAFRDTAVKVAERRWAQNFSKALDFALRTAKRK